jgi:hypothetical protein
MLDQLRGEVEGRQLSGESFTCMTYSDADTVATSISETIPNTQIIWFRGDFDVQFRTAIEANTKSAPCPNKKVIILRDSWQVRWSSGLSPQPRKLRKAKYMTSIKSEADSTFKGSGLFIAKT